MFSYHKRRIYSFFLVALFLSLTTGCKTTVPLENSELQTDISGKAASKKTYSVDIKENTSALYVQSSGSNDITLEFLDSDDNVLSVCSSGTSCFLSYPAVGKYKINMVGSSDYTGANLVASWVDSSNSVLSNGVASTEMSGSTGIMHVKSINIPVSNGAVTFAASEDGVVSLDILDNSGVVAYQCDGTPCVTDSLTDGSYFVRATGLQDFTALTLTASWGGIGSATLENGVATILSGAENDQFVESFYVPSNTDGFMVNMSGNGGYSFQVVDDSGAHVASCGSAECFLGNPSPGLYYIQGVFHSNTVNARLTAIWGGATESTLENGKPISLSGVGEQIILQSIYVPANTTGLMLSAGYASVDFTLYDHDGGYVVGCGGFDCAVPDLAEGVYFVQIHLFEDIVNFNVSVAWGGAYGGTFENGKSISLSGVGEQYLLQSLYVPANTTGLMLSAGYASVDFTLYDYNGGYVVGCGGFDCVVPDLVEGVYFVQIHLLEDIVNFNMSAAWGGTNGGTLENGESISLGGVGEQYLLQSLYMPANTTGLMLSAGYASVDFTLYDHTGGYVTSCGGFDCAVSDLAEGLYFVQVHLFDDIVNFNVSATWGGTNGGTLENGESISLSGVGEQYLLQSLYVPANTTGLMLSAGYASVDFTLYDHTGGYVTSCGGFDCAVSDLAEGLYFVHVHLFEDIANFNVSAAWGGAYGGTLENGESLSLSGVGEQYLLQSLYVPANTTGLMLSAGYASVDFSLFDHSGGYVTSCGGFDCAVSDLAEGLYFVQVHLFEDIANFNVSTAWGGAYGGTLENGGLISLSGVAEQYLLQSLYVPTNATGLMLSAGFASVDFSLFDHNGGYVTSCGGFDCAVSDLAEGLYFVQVHLFEDIDVFHLASAFGGEGVSSLEKGVPLAGQSLVANQFLIQSLNVPVGTNSFSLDVSVAGNVGIEVLNEQGALLTSCAPNVQCTIALDDPGAKFIRIYAFENDVADMSILADW